MKRLIFLLVVFPMIACACTTPQPVATVLGSDTPAATASLPPAASPTQIFTATLLPPTATATPVLIEGTLTIKVNIRSGPGTSYASLGQLNAGDKVQVASRDATGSWYQIIYPVALDGQAWVAAQFVKIPAGTQVPLPATPTPGGPSGRVLQRLNVRSGPGVSFDTLGMLEPNAVVSLTGKNSSASWFQIDYPAGLGGRAWVTAQYIQTDATGLPVLDNYGTPVPGGTIGSTPVPVTSTPTIGPAYADADTPANPGVTVTFSASGTRQFTYSSQVSAPDGDPEDWVAFTPYAANATEARLAFSLTCSGNGRLIVELEQAGSPFSGWGTLACGDLNTIITLPVGQTFQLHLFPAQGTGLQLVDYVLSVRIMP
jgi:uncharacterized protein YraI